MAIVDAYKFGELISGPLFVLRAALFFTSVDLLKKVVQIYIWLVVKVKITTEFVTTNLDGFFPFRK